MLDVELTSGKGAKLGMTRREAREQAFLLIFEQSFNGRPVAEIVEDARAARDFCDDDFTGRLAEGVAEKSGELDELIERHSIGWRKNRISRISMALLRMACYEMLYFDDVPVSVSINEAVELSKKYAGEDDAAFINGILGGIDKELTVPEQGGLEST